MCFIIIVLYVAMALRQLRSNGKGKGREPIKKQEEEGEVCSGEKCQNNPKGETS